MKRILLALAVLALATPAAAETKIDPKQISNGGTSNTTDFLRRDGSWAAPAGGGGLSDGDKGDVTVGGSGTTLTIDNDVVTYGKMQNVSAASKLLGRGDSGSGDPQEITIGSGLSMSGTTLIASGGGGGSVVDAAVRGTTSGAPGTGAFTPNAAATSSRAWSTIATGWWGKVLYVDGAAWEVAYSYWNGTTLSRGTNQLVASSSGSVLSLSSSATAQLVSNSAEDTFALPAWRGWLPSVGSNAFLSLGTETIGTTGTSGQGVISNTSYLTTQPRQQMTSATTANNQAGWFTTSTSAIYSTTAGSAGAEYAFRFGVTALPTGPRMYVGATAANYLASTSEPSAVTGSYAIFGKDSTDTNIQLLTNSNVGSGTKIDTGIALAVDGWYIGRIWWDRGGGKIYALLVRVDTGAIFYATTTTDIPATGATMMAQAFFALSSTTGTAIVAHNGGMFMKTGN